MPTYDYHCADNGRTLQVQHRMSEEVTTWGELCRLAGEDVGSTAPDAAVAKVHLTTQLMQRKNVGSDSKGGSAFGAGSVARAFHTTKNF